MADSIKSSPSSHRPQLPPLITDLMENMSEDIPTAMLPSPLYESPDTMVPEDSDGESMLMDGPMVISPENFRCQNTEFSRDLFSMEEEYVVVDTFSNSNSNSDSALNGDKSPESPFPWKVECLDLSDEDRAKFEAIQEDPNITPFSKVQEGPTITPMSRMQELRNALAHYRWSRRVPSSGSLMLIGLDFSDLLPSPHDLPSPVFNDGDDRAGSLQVPNNTPDAEYHHTWEAMTCADVTITITEPPTPPPQDATWGVQEKVQEEPGRLSPRSFGRQMY
ncbi:hypothetical protein PV10_01191 [Exophiala mesophila]|uniref:Uncharacterized protein n=1 Tax=Exophiala mesophila TaxID=212818 RepID=A0A0D2AEV5_EXOME|nr:uncharacterized protein PV10_01191 [Exophiala mesophila]KIV97438.1 hypothetical protein PV10_01191 [Exophiala mesophila]